jgi:tRNA modification GTPase
MREAPRSTIAALATAPHPAGIAVVRASGPETKAALRALFRGKKIPSEHAREMIFGDLLDYKSGEVIDHALAVFMPGPHSFTGEDVAEFQFHGSPLIVEKLLRSLYAFGCVPAEAGEFTKRAFLNGKLDLAQAEAIGELITATSEQALKIAGEHLKGKFSAVITSLGDPLRDTLAQIEATIDFPDEDISPDSRSALRSVMTTALESIQALLTTYSYGQVVRDGYRVLLCGRPNAGKSSLLNALLGRPRAIVSPISGTTRDLIEESAIIGGYRYVFCDSAGLRSSTQDSIEQMGIELAKERVPWADLVLFIVDATDTSHEWKEVLEYLRLHAKKIWMVTNKLDLNPQAMSHFFCDSTICSQNFYLSVKTRAGLSSLLEALTREVHQTVTHSSEANQIVTNERQRSCLYKAEEALVQTIKVLDEELPLEIVSADLRSTLRSLDELIGKTHTEDILGRVFSKFCIGK